MAKTNISEKDFFEKTGYVFGLIKPSWEAFLLNWSTFLLLWLMPLLLIIALIPAFILPALNNSLAWNISTLILLSAGILVFLAVLILIVPALIKTQILSVQGVKIGINKAFAETKGIVLNYFVAAILIGLIIIGPILFSIPLMFIIVGFFIIPFAIAWAIISPFFLFLVPYLVVDQKLSPINAIKASFELSKQKWQWVLAVIVVNVAISIVTNILTWVPVGFLIASALGLAYMCMPAIVYLKHIKNVTTVKVKSSKRAAKPKLAK